MSLRTTRYALFEYSMGKADSLIYWFRHHSNVFNRLRSVSDASRRCDCYCRCCRYCNSFTKYGVNENDTKLRPLLSARPPPPAWRRLSIVRANEEQRRHTELDAITTATSPTKSQ